MTENEAPATTRPHVHRVPGRRPIAATHPGSRPYDEAPQIGRVAACALGLAYAQREDVEGLQELVAIAEGDEQILEAARHRLAELDVVEDSTRQRADTLLYTAVSHLDRLLA